MDHDLQGIIMNIFQKRILHDSTAYGILRRIAAVLLVCALFMTGCEFRYAEKKPDTGAYDRKNGTTQAAAGEAAAGEDAFAAWLREHLPEAEPVRVSTYIDQYPGSGPKRETDYLAGSIRLDGEEEAFFFDQINKKLYLSDRADELAACAVPYMTQLLFEGVPAGTAGKSFAPEIVGEPNVYLMIPTAPEGSDRKVIHEETSVSMIPVEVQDVEAFVRTPKERDMIAGRLQIRVPEGTDLSGIDAEKLLRIRQENRIRFDELEIWHSGQQVYCLWDEVSFEKTEDCDYGPFTLKAELYTRQEEINEKKGKTTGTSTEYDPSKDLAIVRAEDGFRITYPDPKRCFTFRLLLTQEDFEDAPEVRKLIGEKYDWVLDDDWVEPVYWKETDEGYCLYQENDVKVSFFRDCELRIRQ